MTNKEVLYISDICAYLNHLGHYAKHLKKQLDCNEDCYVTIIENEVKETFQRMKKILEYKGD